MSDERPEYWTDDTPRFLIRTEVDGLPAEVPVAEFVEKKLGLNESND